MNKGRVRRWLKRSLSAIAILVLLVLLVYVSLLWQRPPRTAQEQALFQGIAYAREVRSMPRPMMIHRVSIDLTAPGIQFVVTPGERQAQSTEFRALTTSAFLQRSQVQLAINASYFFPFWEKSWFDFYPHTGDGVNVLGQVISSGVIDSAPQPGWPVVCFGRNQQVQILNQDHCPETTWQATAGGTILIQNGQPMKWDPAIAENYKRYPRTLIGLSHGGQQLEFVLIDGRQPYYSEGAAIPELIEIGQAFKLETMMTLDGGGSTTLAIAGPKGPQVLNAPIHTRWPLRERPVANHIGVYAKPL